MFIYIHIYIIYIRVDSSICIIRIFMYVPRVLLTPWEVSPRVLSTLEAIPRVLSTPWGVSPGDGLGVAEYDDDV
jgi:hypothetical protein